MSAAPALPAGAPPLLALYGATALGKTEVAIVVARRVGADVVVADSMQVYRGLPVLTNQPGVAGPVSFHMVGVVDPSRQYSAGAYAAAAQEAIDGVVAARGRCVLEGGSGLYLRAALGGLDLVPPADAHTRRELEARWARDPEGVVKELRRLDPHTVARLDTANPRRVLRALEQVRAAGRPLASADRRDLWRPGTRYRHVLLALVPDRQHLRDRITRRVDRMLACGALDEVARLRGGTEPSRAVGQAIGVRELTAVLDGALTLDEARERMVNRTTRLVRRQLAWMRKLPAHHHIEVGGRRPDDVADEVVRRWVDAARPDHPGTASAW